MGQYMKEKYPREGPTEKEGWHCQMEPLFKEYGLMISPMDSQNIKWKITNFMKEILLKG